MTTKRSQYPSDGPPHLPTHLAVIAKSGEPLDSASMLNGEMTLARCSTFGSARTYSYVLRGFFSFMQSRADPPVHAGADDVTLYLASIRHYAPTTQGCYWGVLCSFFDRALERALIVRSPFAGRRRPRPQPKTPTPALMRVQAQELLDSIAVDFGHPDRDLTARRDYTMVSAMLHLCVRSTEITDARWSGIGRTDGQYQLSFTGKGRKPATMALPDAVFDVIRMWKAQCEALTGGPMLPNDPIFIALDHGGLKDARSRRGRRPLRRLSTRSVSRIVSDRIAAAGLNLIDGLPGLRFAAHCLRATGANISKKAGADVFEIQALMRHRNVQTTVDYMRNLDPTGLAAIARIDLNLEVGHSAADGASASSSVSGVIASVSEAPRGASGQRPRAARARRLVRRR